jgi:hypothetical protein
LLDPSKPPSADSPSSHGVPPGKGSSIQVQTVGDNVGQRQAKSRSLHLFLPRRHRPSPQEKWVGFPQLSRLKRLRARGDFRGCRYFVMFRPPSLLAPRSSLPLRILPQGSRGFYVRAERGCP